MLDSYHFQDTILDFAQIGLLAAENYTMLLNLEILEIC